MKTDRNTNCFKYVTIYKTSCSWCTGLWAADGGRGGAAFVKLHQDGACKVHTAQVDKMQILL